MIIDDHRRGPLCVLACVASASGIGLRTLLAALMASTTTAPLF
jgi:hypothetical protein